MDERQIRQIKSKIGFLFQNLLLGRVYNLDNLGKILLHLNVKF